MKLWFKKTQAAEPKTASETGKKPAEADGTNANASDDDPPPPDKLPPPAGAPKTPAVAAPPAPAASQHSRSLFKQFVEGLYDAVLITDVKGHIININARVTEFFGYTASEAWDLPVGRVAPGITDVVFGQICQGLSRERFILMEARCTRKDQTTFPAEIAISQVEITNDGNLLFCVRNIERRQQQVQQLQTARRLLDHVPTAAVACDRNGAIKVANLALARMLGYDDPEILVENPFSVIWREPRAPEVIQRVLNGEATKEPVTVVNRHGRHLQLVVTFTPDLDAHQKPIGFLAAFTSAAVVSLNSR